MAELFEVDRTRITHHISNIYKDEALYADSTCAKNALVQFEGKRKVKRTIKLYNLDMIISVGYRVKSKRGITFRKWATGILKDYMIQGYAINQKRIEALNKTVEIQTRIIANTLEIDEKAVYDVVMAYTDALDLLDDYDHGCIKKPEGKSSIYKLTYNECRILIDRMKFGDTSEVFGIEKEKGKLEGILAAIYQNVFVKNYIQVSKKKLQIFFIFLSKTIRLLMDVKELILRYF